MINPIGVSFAYDFGFFGERVLLTPEEEENEDARKHAINSCTNQQV